MKWLGAAIIAVGLSAAASAQAQKPAAPESLPEESAFVEHRLTLQLSDGGDAKQAQVLNVAYNVLTYYGPDKVSIDVVAFGQGIDLLRDGNPNAERISSLVSQGVHFDICMNSVETFERNTGKPFPLNPLAHPVQAGVPRIMTLAEHGYTTVRP
jgi:intracellular sulfur oxidation DsrE/DsrF family protein